MEKGYSENVFLGRKASKVEERMHSSKVMQDKRNKGGKLCDGVECSGSQLQTGEFKFGSHHLLLCDLGQDS